MWVTNVLANAVTNEERSKQAKISSTAGDRTRCDAKFVDREISGNWGTAHAQSKCPSGVKATYLASRGARWRLQVIISSELRVGGQFVSEV